MPFGLKNAGVTFQRAINFIFHELIGGCMEVYIDNLVVKSTNFNQHLRDLEQAFTKIRRHQLKMNPTKCAFGHFWGFLVHHRGIKVDSNKAKAILEARPPRNKKELQSLIGKVNFFRRFIANSAGKLKAFTSLLKLRAADQFVCGQEQ